MPRTFDVLSVVHRPLAYEIDGNPADRQVPEFAINGVPLSTLLGVDRGLGSSECNLDMGQLSGESAPSNQFGTGRLVLYGCHCGSDYCGVFSCQLVERDGSVEWRDISFEDDSGVHASGASAVWAGLRPIGRLVFEKSAYLSGIQAAVEPPGQAPRRAHAQPATQARRQPAA